MPAKLLPIMTTTDPTCSFCMRSAASTSRSSPSTLTTRGRKIDLTFTTLTSHELSFRLRPT
jgi:hypothetical protein